MHVLMTVESHIRDAFLTRWEYNLARRLAIKAIYILEVLFQYFLGLEFGAAEVTPLPATRVLGNCLIRVSPR